MSDTPQNGEVSTGTSTEVTTGKVNTEVVTTTEINDSAVDSGTTSQVQAESKEQVDELAKQKANDAWNKQYGQLKQAERDNASKDLELEQFRAAERERQAAAVGDIPPMPDAFDDDFDNKVKSRDEAITAQATYAANNAAYLQSQQFQQQQTAQTQQAVMNKLSDGFYSNATTGGASNEEVNLVVNTLNTMNPSQDLSVAIMSDASDGYVIAKYLAGNPMEMHELNTMNPVMAGAKLAEIKLKASALKPTQTETPQPVDQLSGAGAKPDTGKYPNSGGATFT